MTKRIVGRISLGFAAWAASVAPALAQFSQRPFAVAGGEGGGGARGRPDRLAHGASSPGSPISSPPRCMRCMTNRAPPGASLASASLMASFTLRDPDTARRVLASYMLANERSLKRGAVMALMAALLASAGRDRACRRGGVRLQGDRVADESRGRLDRARELLRRRRMGLWLVWRKGGSAHRGSKPTCRS